MGAGGAHSQASCSGVLGLIAARVAESLWVVVCSMPPRVHNPLELLVPWAQPPPQGGSRGFQQLGCNWLPPPQGPRVTASVGTIPAQRSDASVPNLHGVHPNKARAGAAAGSERCTGRRLMPAPGLRATAPAHESPGDTDAAAPSPGRPSLLRRHRSPGSGGDARPPPPSSRRGYRPRCSARPHHRSPARTAVTCAGCWGGTGPPSLPAIELRSSAPALLAHGTPRLNPPLAHTGHVPSVPRWR